MANKGKRKAGRPKQTLENETQTQKDAFEMFYALGDGMSVRARVLKISDEFDKSYATIFNWKKTFKWDDRKKERDKRNRRKIERATDTAFVETRMKYAKIVELTIDDYYQRALEGEIIRIEKPGDIDRLMRLGMYIRDMDKNEDSEKTPEEIKKELKERAEEYDDYFKELEARPAGETLGEESEDGSVDAEGEADSGNPDSG